MINRAFTLFGFILHTDILDVLNSNDIKILINIYKPITDLYCMNKLMASPGQCKGNYLFMLTYFNVIYWVILMKFYV